MSVDLGELAFNPDTGNWEPVPSNTTGQVIDKPSVSPPIPKPASSANTQVNSAGKANQEQAVLEYNTLEADLSLRACDGILKIKPDTTINIDGVGSFLSGQYYVTSVSYSLDSSSGFSVSCSVIKTGFGPSLKAPAESEESPDAINKTDSTAFKVGDKVRIVGDDATYANASDGVKVPNWVKQKDLEVKQVSSDGTKVLVQPINSWTYTKFVSKV